MVTAYFWCEKRKLICFDEKTKISADCFGVVLVSCYDKNLATLGLWRRRRKKIEEKALTYDAHVDGVHDVPVEVPPAGPGVNFMS
jgi:hypothetical protein